MLYNGSFGDWGGGGNVPQNDMTSCEIGPFHGRAACCFLASMEAAWFSAMKLGEEGAIQQTVAL